ncbi:urea ABC transporter ATP-binding protein, partial [Paenibacillus darwinianus]
SLSHGERQWLEIGMLLAQDPELIILDEPTAGMTADETYKTGELIRSVFKDRSVIVVEHDMAFVRQIADIVTVLHQGRFLAEGPLSEIERNAKVQEVYLKEDAHA